MPNTGDQVTTKDGKKGCILYKWKPANGSPVFEIEISHSKGRQGWIKISKPYTRVFNAKEITSPANIPGIRNCY